MVTRAARIVAVLLLACGGGKDTDASSAGTASTADTTGTASTSGTAGTSSTTTTASPTTTGGLDSETACTAQCDAIDACMLLPDDPACVRDCVVALDESTCGAALAGLLLCASALPCDEFAAYLFEADPGSCQAEYDAVSSCTGGLCNVEFGDCEIRYECQGLEVREMRCDADDCTCFEGGAAVGSCPADGVCAMQNTLDVKAETCCGF